MLNNSLNDMSSDETPGPSLKKVRLNVFHTVIYYNCHEQIQRGWGQRVRTPLPEKSQKYRVSVQHWFGPPEKLQSYRARISC